MFSSPDFVLGYLWGCKCTRLQPSPSGLLNRIRTQVQLGGGTKNRDLGSHGSPGHLLTTPFPLPPHSFLAPHLIEVWATFLIDIPEQLILKYTIILLQQEEFWKDTQIVAPFES